jgi:hypothetical protein
MRRLAVPTSRKHLSLIVAACLALLSDGSKLFGQAATSNYAAAQLNLLKNQNSASSYSIANFRQQAMTSAIGTTGVPGVNFRSYGLQSTNLSSRRKPFSGSQLSPTVSPYLALSNPFATATDYYNVVRPQQEQRRVNQQVAHQQALQQRELNKMAAQGPYSITGNADMAPTGHAAGYMQYGAYSNTGSYFPAPTKPQSQRR